MIGSNQELHSDETLVLAAQSGVGIVRLRVPLKVEFRSDERTYSGVELCLSDRGLWLLAATPTQPLVLELLAEPSLRYEVGRVRDNLCVKGNQLPIGARQRSAVREALALARLQRHTPAEPGELPSLIGLLRARHLEPVTSIEEAALRGLLERDEIVLGWLHGKTRLPIYSPLSGTAAGEARLLVTDRRSLVLALSELGDVREIALEEPLAVEQKLSNAELALAEHGVASGRHNARLFVELGLLSQKSAGAPRLYECARLNFVAREAGTVAFTRSLLERAAALGDCRAPFALACLRLELGDTLPAEAELGAALSALERTAQADSLVAESFREWGFDWHIGTQLVEGLRKLGSAAEPWVIELHRSVHDARARAEPSPRDRAQADIALAEHLLAAGRTEGARQLLLRRLAELPSEELEDLLPRTDADLTRGVGGQALRIRVHELLAVAGAGPLGQDVNALAELARLQPLVQARIQALSERASGTLAERARAVLALFEPGGARAAAEGEAALPEPDAAALSSTSMDRVLQHPLVREGGALIGRLQALLASVPTPEHDLLRDYCEGLSSGRYPAAERALSSAARVLGVTEVQGYISRGAKAVGLRAYEAHPPFVLIGGRHLEGDDAYRMTEAELRFAVSAEVAHLRYGHTRVTSSEVWAGALSKSRQGLDLALGVLPALSGFRFAEHLQRLAARLPRDTLRNVLRSVATYAEHLKSSMDSQKGNEAVLSRLNEELVAAHRVMQLTADRAGLVLNGDIVAAVRAMLLVRSDTREFIDAIERSGLDALLSRRTPDGKMAHQDLAIRIGALFSFYLSDEYERLRGELAGG